MKKLYIIILFICFSPLTTIQSQEKALKWERMSGKWIFENSNVTEIQGKSLSWNYYEILEYNSILSVNSYKNYTSFEVNAKIHDRVDSPVDLMYSFAIRSESQSWYYHIYAIKLSGGYWGLNKASLIYSDRIDKTKSLNTKNNTFVKELATANCKIKYNKFYNYKVNIEEGNVVFYINNEKILSSPFPEESYEGRIAISARNIKIVIEDVQLKQNKKIIFEDNFNVDSISVRTVKAQKIPVNQVEAENK